MKIAIIDSGGLYTSRWIEYCKENKYIFKVVKSTINDLITEVEDFDIIMWHYDHRNNDNIFAKQVCFALEQSGKIVFPNFKTGWHFDDKLGEKYLFEALDIKSAPAFAFFNKKEAINWANMTTYPKVFKLRGGAGSSNVYLARSKRQAINFINKAFGRGFKPFNNWGNFRDKIRLYKSGTGSLILLAKAFGRIFVTPVNYKALSIQKQYAYFQEFIPNDGYDMRVEIIGDKAIACVRFARKNDFRASGGHLNFPNHKYITSDVIKFAFDVVDKIGSQSCAMDIVRNKNNNDLFLIETSYCFGIDEDEFDNGYWDREGKLHDIKINGLDLIIDMAVSDFKKK